MFCCSGDVGFGRYIPNGMYMLLFGILGVGSRLSVMYMSMLFWVTFVTSLTGQITVLVKWKSLGLFTTQ